MPTPILETYSFLRNLQGRRGFEKPASRIKAIQRTSLLGLSFNAGGVTFRRPDPHAPKAKGSDPLFSRSNECFFTMSDNTPHPRVNADRMCEFRFPMDEICLIPRVAPRQKGGWWSQTGSNRRPHACKARALPTELWPQRAAA